MSIECREEHSDRCAKEKRELELLRDQVLRLKLEKMEREAEEKWKIRYTDKADRMSKLEMYSLNILTALSSNPVVDDLNQLETEDTAIDFSIRMAEKLIVGLNKHADAREPKQSDPQEGTQGIQKS